MRETLMDILTDLRPDVDFENETNLISGGILESFDIVSLVSELTDEFDITIRPKDLVPENFNSVDAMLALITKLVEE
ncbi:acyl carrier protein [Roseburia sp. MUC/MUC-530-WT-4D]|uniref:Acyl carrier protein n=1 Tax=Roseburia porci TaxID=2605790 RepID=A0A6L5YR86_9FIRM|nr:phosphopantetheine-binding protein [Roseburia porci]MCI5516128.1 phosphopantetheine-binding protein [Roseburia sp.]MDD6742674.1 phosphopantetheine-binding protein [Roseburia porci]MST75093.1 acyl carrier protein [Roseburia porci]